LDSWTYRDEDYSNHSRDESGIEDISTDHISAEWSANHYSSEINTDIDNEFNSGSENGPDYEYESEPDSYYENEPDNYYESEPDYYCDSEYYY
jgi:hypothetical protein